MTGNLTFDGTGKNVTLMASNIADTKSFGIGITPIVASIIFARNVNNTTCTINSTDFIYKSGITFGFRSNATQTTIFTPLTMNSNQINNVLNPTNAQDVATKNYVDTHLSSGLGTVTSPINMNGNEITGLPTSITSLTDDSSSISKKVFLDVMDDALALKLNLSGGAMSGNLDMTGNSILNVIDPTNAQDVATKHYVDTHLSSGLGTVTSPINMNGNEITGLPTSITNETCKASRVKREDCEAGRAKQAKRVIVKHSVLGHRGLFQTPSSK